MGDNSSAIVGGLGGMSAGATIGAELGTLIPIPGLGTALGAVAGAALGAIAGGKKQKAVDAAMAGLMAIPNVDPNQVNFKDQLMREKKMVQSGFSTDFQVARDIRGQSEAGGMSVAAEMAKSNPALALMSMDQIGKNADNSVNKALGTISTRGMGYTQMIGDLIDNMGKRKTQINIMKATQGMATATQNMQDFNANSNAGMMKLMSPSVINGFKGLFASGTTPGGVGSPLSYDPLNEN